VKEAGTSAKDAREKQHHRQSDDDDDSARERQLAGTAVKSRARGPTITQLRAKQAALNK